MTLPTAVKRKAELARQMLAEQNGKPPSSLPQATDDEYLQPDSNPVKVSHDVTPTDMPTSNESQDLANTDTHRSHRLSDEIMDTVDTDTSADSGDANSTPSPKDTATDSAQAQTLPQFIDESDWKSRYTALRIARDARIAALEKELSQQTTDNQGLLQELEQLRETPIDATNRFELDDETRGALGEDQAKAFDQFNESVEQRFTQHEAEQKEVSARVVQQFESDLGSMIPRWREINTDQAFLDWLNKKDDVLGVRRQDMLDSFVDNRDAGSVAAIFRSFVSSNGHVQQRNGTEPSPELQPSRAGAESDSMVEVWDQSEIADFYQRKSRLYQAGKLKGDLLQQVLAEETNIRKAMSEGRVDYDR